MGGVKVSGSAAAVIFVFITKAFDTVRHDTLLSKMATLRIPDNIYNWINDFLVSTITVRDSMVSARLLRK